MDSNKNNNIDYALGTYTYSVHDFAPQKLFDMITDIRVSKPYVIADTAKKRKRRSSLTNDGKLVILACDHPARNVTSVGKNPAAMGDRTDYLGRILRVITSDEIDGAMTTPDIMDDLFIVDYIYREKCGKSFLDNKVLAGCMNRSGLAGFKYELDDMVTAFDAESIHELGLDASKILLRLEKQSEESIKTLRYCSDAINECNKYNIPIMIEPLPVELTGDGLGYRTKMDKVSLIQTIGVASALGSSTRNHWIKIPYIEGYEEVVKSTTMPILMLGGASEGSPVNTVKNFAAGMGAGSNVRGALVGRNVLYPGKDDPRSVGCAISKIVHEGISVTEALSYIKGSRGGDMEFFKFI